MSKGSVTLPKEITPLAAAVRIAECRLTQLDEHARAAFNEASQNGRFGSPSYHHELRKRCAGAYREAISIAALRFAWLKGRRARNYTHRLPGALIGLRMKVLATFEEYAGLGPTLEGAQTDLAARLYVQAEETCLDFEAGLYVLLAEKGDLLRGHVAMN